MRAAWIIALVVVLGCEARDEAEERPAESAAPPPAMPAEQPSARPPERPSRSSLTVIAGGDVSFGRTRGQLLLRDPSRNDLAPVAGLLASADVRFVNLECPIADRNGETVSPINHLVFNAPPQAAAALARAEIDLVSLANNHAWDYGRAGLFETFEHLERAEIAYVGAGRTRDEAYAPQLVTRDGFTIAFVAVTAVWNQEWSPHPGREHVADAEPEALAAAIRAARARPGVDKVVVSHHGGYEYVDQPHQQTRELLRAAIDAGADAVIGHHPHVVQRAGFVKGRPLLYSLGNLLMRMANGQPWTEYGLLARLTFHREAPTEVVICPVRTFGYEPIPLAADQDRTFHEAHFRAKFERLLRFGAMIEADAAAELGDFGEDGCAPLRPAR